MRTEVEQAMALALPGHIVLVPYNEPDGNWFDGLQAIPPRSAAFEDEWLQTYQFIKGLWPPARIAGPNFSGTSPTRCAGSCSSASRTTACPTW